MGDDFSIDFWTYLNNHNDSAFVSQYRTGAGTNRRYEIILQSNLIKFFISRDGTSGTGESISCATSFVPVTTWTHICVSWRASDGQYRIVIDGVERASGTQSVVNQTGTPEFAVGDRANAAIMPLEGRIDDVACYNRLLTDAEVAWRAAGNGIPL